MPSSNSILFCLIVFCFCPFSLLCQETIKDVPQPKPTGIYEAAVELYHLGAKERLNSNSEEVQKICERIDISAEDLFGNTISGLLFQSAKSTSTSTSANAKSVGNQLASLPVTNIADGLSIFLVNRAKQELSIAFFNKLTDKTNSLPILQENFPFTIMQLDGLESNIYKFQQYIQSLRQAFTADLKGLPGNFGNYLMSRPELIQRSSDRALAGDGLRAMQTFIAGSDVSEIVHYFAGGYSYIQALPKEELQVLKGILKTTDLLLHAFQNKDGKWVDFNDFNQMLLNEDQLNIFLSLLVTKAESLDISFGSKLKFADLVKDRNHFKSVLSGMLFQVNQLILYHERIKSNDGEKSFEDYYNLMSGIFSILETGYKVWPDHMKGAEKPISQEDKVESFFEISRGLSALTLFVYQKRYSSAITEMSLVLDKLGIIGKNKSGNKNSKEWVKALKYANFFALIAEAESGQEVATVIEQFAAPVGSSSEKRKHGVTSGLNGYLGANFGTEIPTGDQVPSMIANANFYAVSAPIGLSVNVGWDWGSFGVFGSVIDLGAVTAYRFNDENTEDLPEVTLGNILAPGINLELGFSKFPLTIGYGWQLGPNLRKVTMDGLEISEITNRRENFFLRVDMPLVWF